MRLKSLTVVGFKSFAERTVIHFDQEVIGIVGPNGCGKSNIVDAIRWCMGEQSARHLRGRTMEDVIFNGSESRAPHPFAEVTLTFDNTDEGAPFEYRDYPEIAVTRRLLRSGDSDYLINKTPVRLKDITDLFLGTGVGTKAYSIVEQGKIGLIVSAKPEDRRTLIEEAAGITKYKSKKKQAERKIELTQQNLLRVGDIVAEIDRNLGSLKRQAAKAERYVAYRSELEDLQLYEASHKLLEFTGRIRYETGNVAEAKTVSEEVRCRSERLEAEVATLQVELTSARVGLDEARQASFVADQGVQAAEAEIRRALDLVEHQRAVERQLVSDGVHVKAQYDALAEEQHAVAERVTETESLATLANDEKVVSERRAEETSERAKVAQSRLQVAQGELSRARAVAAGAEERLASMARRQTELEGRIARLTSELSSLEASHEGLRTALHDHERQKVEAAEEHRRAVLEREGLETRLQSVKEAVSASQSEVDSLQQELAAKRAQLHTLAELNERHEGAGQGALAILEGGSGAVVGLIADRLNVPAHLERAVAALLGDELEDVLVSDRESGFELLTGLVTGNLGRATVRSVEVGDLSSDSEARAVPSGAVCRLVDEVRAEGISDQVLRSVFGDAVVVEDLAAAEGVLAGGFGGGVVTLDGFVLRADGRVTGGSGEQAAAGLLRTQRQARELQGLVHEREGQLTAVLERHETLRLDLTATQSGLEQARRDAHAAELRSVACERDLGSARAALEAASTRLAAVRSDSEEQRGLLFEGGREHDEVERALSEATETANRLESEVAEASTLFAAINAELGPLNEEVTERQVGLARVLEQLNSARDTSARLGRSLSELRAREASLLGQLSSVGDEIGAAAGRVFASREVLEVRLDGAKAAREALASVRGEFEVLEANFTWREADLKSERTAAEGARVHLGEREFALRELEIGLTHLNEGVAEKFRGLRLSTVVGDYHLRPEPDENVGARIRELTTLLERMGSVNLDAMREHDEAEKRFEFYSTQQKDLETALADLEKAIAQMNRESKRLFAATFEAVNQKFEELFPKMFRGGRASLRLTQPDDMLETGIDILAQPPGKKLSSIELMSGGEKALTAASLIFAIFQVKPSPFCILDEVDAPLDEANVARYNEVVRSMTDRSQFILVTHIKKTMQMVDLLYGVTMQEKGRIEPGQREDDPAAVRADSGHAAVA